MDTVDLPDIISRKQLAEYLGMTEPALSQMATRKQGPPFVRFGRSIRYRRDDVLRWLDSRMVDPAEQAAPPATPARRRRNTKTSAASK